MRILVISDVHANKYALETLEKLELNYDFVVFLGDAVDYGPHPDYCVDWLRSNADVWVMGNHDYAVAYNVDCGCGDLTHELSVYTREKISLRLLGENDIKHLRLLPFSQFLNLDGKSLYVVHGAPIDPLYKYIYPNTPNNKILESLRVKNKYGFVAGIPNAEIFLMGHTHIPMKRVVSHYTLLNPGSLGQSRDGDNRASVGVLDLESMEWRVIRFKYDMDKLISDIRRLINDKKYLRWLETLYLTADPKKAKSVVVEEKQNY